MSVVQKVAELGDLEVADAVLALEGVLPSEVFEDIKTRAGLHIKSEDRSGEEGSSLGTTPPIPSTELHKPVGDEDNQVVVEVPTCCWCNMMPGTRSLFGLKKIYKLQGNSTKLCPMCDEVLSVAALLKEYATPFLDKELAVLITGLISAASLAIEKVLDDKKKKRAMRETLAEALRFHDDVEAGRQLPGLQLASARLAARSDHRDDLGARSPKRAKLSRSPC